MNWIEDEQDASLALHILLAHAWTVKTTYGDKRNRWERATIRGVSEIHTTGNLSSSYFGECQSHETGLIAERWYSYKPIQVYPRHLSPPTARGTRGIFVALVLVNAAAD